MKIGNLSQTIVKAPNFYLYPTGKNVETFQINKKRKLFNERSLIGAMNELNYNNNYRHYYHPIKSERTPILSRDNEKLFSSHDMTGYDMKEDKIYSTDIKKFNDYLNRASLSKIVPDDFKEGVQLNISNLVTKINKSKKEVLSSDQLGSKGCDNRFLCKTFPKIIMKPYDKRQIGNSTQLITNRRIYDEDELFKQTLRDKVISLRMVSSKVKEEIRQRKCAIDCRRSYANRFHYVPTFKEAIDNALETMGRSNSKLLYSMKQL